MGYAVLNIDINELEQKLSLSRSRLKSYVEKIDQLVADKTQLQEQASLYAENFASMRAASVCSLREWRETKELVDRTASQIQRATSLISSTEEAVAGEKATIARFEANLAPLKQELASYGRLYEFPRHDN